MSIVVLIAFAIGWREALVTLVVIPTTILLTLFAAKVMGYTINRVSLFALIFSIGILVDDAIVVVENIARHWAMKDGRARLQGAIEAVAEVGNPTVVATLTVVAALLPMLFVSGPDGALYGADPGQCVGGDGVLVLRRHGDRALADAAPASGRTDRCMSTRPRMARACSAALYRRFATPVLRSRRSAWIFLVAVGVATVLVCLLFVTKSVTVKLLPFDNKSEMSVVVDLPEGATLEDTERTLFSIADVARQLPEIRSIETYAGTPAPFNFNGLVRHYYLRELPELGELHLNLAPRDERKRSQPRHRARSARAPEDRDLAGRHSRPSGRSAAGAARAGDAARRGLRARSSTAPARGRA